MVLKILSGLGGLLAIVLFFMGQLQHFQSTAFASRRRPAVRFTKYPKYP
jgi:hypothetical protein